MVQRGKALATHKSGRTDFIKLSADLYIYAVTYMCIHTHALHTCTIKKVKFIHSKTEMFSPIYKSYFISK